VSASQASLQDIHGPSALGGGARRFFHLVWVISSTDFKLTYFGSVLGYLWSLMRPLMLFGVLYVVFSEVVRLGDGVKNYPVLLLLNIVLFTFFQEATQNAVTSAVLRENLVRKMHFPRMVIPLSTVLTAAFNMMVNMAAVFVFLVAYGVNPRASWLLFPLIVLLFVTFTAGVAMLLSALYPRYRDVAPIWAVLSTILFYGSPVLYPIEAVPEDWRAVVLANPLAALLESARVAVVDASAPTVVEAAGSELAWLVPTIVFVALCALGFWIFNREAPRIAEEL
jgi:ABC-2 type transport system permease protein